MNDGTPLSHFLGLHGADFALIDRYRDRLEEGAEGLARHFYDYLLAFPVTAAVFRDFSKERLEALIHQQADHLRKLLRSHLDANWRQTMRHIGVIHQQLGIEPAWVAGAYILYWQHWQQTLRRIPNPDREPLRGILFRLLVGDLMLQLEGYAHASQETDAERLGLLQVLLGVLSVSGHEEAPQPEELLQRIAAALPIQTRGVPMAGYLITTKGKDLLTTEYMAGARIAELEIPQQAGDPCWEALESGQVQIVDTAGPGALPWLQSLQGVAAEVGIFPFGAADLRGVGLVGAKTKGYFRQVGSAYFQAFTHLGALVLQLRNQALRDPLTGLPNRALLMDRLEHACHQALRQERLLGIGLLDLDGFKQVNDRLGHEVGDRLLKAVVERLHQELRAEDTIARIGGDEFALLLPSIERLEELEVLCERILAAIRQPLKIRGESITVSGSIGLTLYPLDDSDARTLLRHADLALYAAKAGGRDQYHLHTQALDEAVQADAALRSRLEKGLREDRLPLLYQPMVSTTGVVLGVEALLYLQDQSAGQISPSALANAIDHPRLARPIGRFILAAALQQAALWLGEGLNLRLAIKISARHLLDARFLEDLHEALARHPALPPQRLELEITESAPLQDQETTLQRLQECRNGGVRIALDQFGIGNAPLRTLRRLPLQSIKIDQGLIRAILQHPHDLAIVAGIITTGRMMHLDVIADGVETAEHCHRLYSIGCKILQGPYFATPMPAAAIAPWLAAYRPPSCNS